MKISDKEYDKYIRFYLDSMFEPQKKTSKKRLRGIDRVKRITGCIKKASGEKDYLYSSPLIAAWNLTSACNFRCVHCLYSEKEYSSKDDLSTEEALNLADDLIEAGVVFVQLSGGEVFLRPDTMDIVRRFIENNVSVTLLTNGSLLTDDNINEIAELFSPYKDTVQISLDAATAETFKKIRRSDKFDKINENIKKLTSRGVVVDNVCTVNNINQDEILDICKLTKTLGTSNFVVGSMIDFNDGHYNINADNRALFKIYYELINNENLDRSNILGFWLNDELLNIPEVLKIIEEPHYQELIKKQYKKSLLKSDCQSHDKITVQSDGRMYLCINALNYDVAPLGSYKENSFKEIWERRWDNILYQPRNREESQCGNCKYSAFCKGGCKIDAYIRTKNINMPAKSCCVGCI